MEIRNYYEDLANNYDQNRFENSYGRYIHLLENQLLKNWIVKDEKKGAIIDMACGTGRLSHYCEIGIDCSESMLQRAAIKFPDKKFILKDVINDSFDDFHFVQGIYSFHFIMHLSPTDFKHLLEKVKTLLPQGSFLIFDFPSKFRRPSHHSKIAKWHASSSYTMQEIKEIAGSDFQIVRTKGILFIPIHRFPAFLRKWILPIEKLISIFLAAQFASYIAIKLVKK